MNRSFAKILVAAFCLWQMFAVGMYALPRGATDALTPKLQNTFLPIVSPYIFITSQWQQWNLFSPDPLRAVYQYKIEREVNGTWEPVILLTPQMHPVYRHADEVKLLGRIHEQGFDLVREQYLKNKCKQLGIAASTHMRMVQQYYVINVKPTPADPNVWIDQLTTETFCTPS